MRPNRVRILGPVIVCWPVALAALYLHPALWVLFTALVGYFVYRELRFR